MATVNKIDLDKLDEYIVKLEKLHTEWLDASYKFEPTEENSGYMVQEMYNLETEYQNIQTAFVNLIDKTTQYMKNRKAAVESQENIATDSMETNTTINKPSGKHGTGSANSNATHRTAMVK